MDLVAAPSDADTTDEAIPKTYGDDVVRLITACKVPHGHGCRVQVQLEKKLDRCDSVIFYPDQERLYRAGVTMEESLLTVEDGQCVQLTVYNRGPSSVTLGEGEVVGKVEVCSPVEGESDEQLAEGFQADSQSKIGQINHVIEGKRQKVSPEDRHQLLLETLKLQGSVAPDQIKEWILQHDESFAMDDTELGRTDLVEYHVDTGDQAPVRQRARREPFALRAKVREMVDDMLRRYAETWRNSAIFQSHFDGKEKGRYLSILCRLQACECRYATWYLSPTESR